MNGSSVSTAIRKEMVREANILAGIQGSNEEMFEADPEFVIPR